MSSVNPLKNELSHQFYEMNSLVFNKLNEYQRFLSECYQNVATAKVKRSISDGVFEYSSVCDMTFDKSENSSNNELVFVGTSPAQNDEVRITIEDGIIEKNMNLLNSIAFYRRFVPDCITCHHVWLVIHILITIGLCVLYFTSVLNVSAGIIAICELLFGVLVRNEIFIALLHRLIALIPVLKYEFNRLLHCIGGLHVSAAFAAFVWLLISLAFEKHGLAVRITGGILLAFIVLISTTAIPTIRRRFHNIFEHIHRYAGWTSLIILAIHVVFLQLDQYNTFHVEAILNVPVIVLLLIIFIIILPWVYVRKVNVQFSQPSKDLTIITFPDALYPYGSTTRISFDGHEWHAFAIALVDPWKDQHSILVAAVGDWTKALADKFQKSQLPDHIWTRRIKGLGFMYSIHAYRKVLIVCTGAGIAPALPYIKDPLPTTHVHLLWIAKAHQDHYGEYVWNLIEKLRPYVSLHDTSTNGRPGAQLVFDHFINSKSEAVFIVSNEKFTNEVTNALWRKGIPCFGALFDS